jgi:hypothetical protein
MGNYKRGKGMEEKFAGIGSTVGFVIVDENEFCQVKIVDSKITRSAEEVSKDSELGKTLMFCKEGETLFVESQEPYEIKILNIVNPVKKPGVTEIKTSPREEPVFVGDFVPATYGNYASFESSFDDGLVPMHAYGRKAKDVYLKGCEYFGWDYSKLGSFCSQKLLFDKNCSREGFSVWFLPYSNLNNYRNSATNWIDFISSDFEKIKEVWKEMDERFFTDDDIRITFAKQRNGQYLYLGVFQAKEFDEENRCKIYYKIDGNYC